MDASTSTGKGWIGHYSRWQKCLQVYSTLARLVPMGSLSQAGWEQTCNCTRAGWHVSVKSPDARGCSSWEVGRYFLSPKERQNRPWACSSCFSPAVYVATPYPATRGSRQAHPPYVISLLYLHLLNLEKSSLAQKHKGKTILLYRLLIIAHLRLVPSYWLPGPVAANRWDVRDSAPPSMEFRTESTSSLQFLHVDREALKSCRPLYHVPCPRKPVSRGSVLLGNIQGQT